MMSSRDTAWLWENGPETPVTGRGLLGDWTMVQGPCGFAGEQVRTIDDRDLNNVSRGGREVEEDYVVIG